MKLLNIEVLSTILCKYYTPLFQPPLSCYMVPTVWLILISFYILLDVDKTIWYYQLFGMCVLWYNAKPWLRLLNWTCTVDPGLWTWDLYLDCGLGILTSIWTWTGTLDLDFGLGLWTLDLDFNTKLFLYTYTMVVILNNIRLWYGGICCQTKLSILNTV